MTEHKRTSIWERPLWTKRLINMPPWLYGCQRIDGRKLDKRSAQEMVHVHQSFMMSSAPGQLIFWCTMIFLFVVGYSIQPPLRNYPGAIGFLAWVFAAIPIGALSVWISRRLPSLLRAQRARLREIGHPICAQCGYDLSHNDPNAGPCPECGRDLAEMPPVNDSKNEQPREDHSSSSPPSAL